ncbi:MAG: TIR domain-containing protein [Planctomycetes bacterium]|nr:TIR domain-containing protein [Planctomycetota bacterium]
MPDSPKRFRVAFSFAGEKRNFVARVASLLASRFGEEAILYDKYHEAEFARGDLDIYLPKLYHDKSDLIVVVICPDYDKKEWPGLEWRAIRALLKKRKDKDVMLCRFEHAELEGLYDAGYVDLDDKTPEQTAVRILERLALNEGKPKDHYTAGSADQNARTTTKQTAPGDFLSDYPEPQPKWVGRKTEMSKLRRAWGGRRRRIQAVVGFGGEGKTALTRRFTESLRRRRVGTAHHRPLVVWWSFYFNKAADAFFAAVLTHFGIPLTEEGHPLAAEQRARKLVNLLRTGVNGRRLLLVLDGLETLQESTRDRVGRVTDTGLRELLRATLNDAEPDTDARGMLLISTREPLVDLRRDDDPRYAEITLEELSVPDGVALLTREYGLTIEQDDAERFVKDIGGHALTLTLTGALHAELPDKTSLADLQRFIEGEEAKVTDPALTTRREKYHRLPGYVLRHCAAALSEQECQFLRLLSCCVRPATRQDVEQVFLHPLKSEADEKPFNDELVALDYVSLRTRVISRLVRLRLVHGREVDEHAEGEQEETGYDMHPLVRRHFYEDDPHAGPDRAASQDGPQPVLRRPAGPPGETLPRHDGGDAPADRRRPARLPGRPSPGGAG